MFTARNKTTILNEGIVPSAPAPESLPLSVDPTTETNKPAQPVVPSIPVPSSNNLPPVPPQNIPPQHKNINSTRINKVLLTLIPVTLVVGVMILVSFLVSQYRKPSNNLAVSTPIPTLFPATPVPTPEPDPFRDWKAYTNRTSEISFKYPPNVALKEETKSSLLSLILSSETDGTVELAQIVVSKTQSVENLVSTYVSGNVSSDLLATEEIQISGVSGKMGQFTVASGGEGVPVNYAYVSHDGLNYLIIGKDISQKDIFLMIISTIRFVTPGVTDSWVDFSSKAGSFSLKYPPTWILSSKEEAVATDSSKLITLRKNESDEDYQNITIQVSSVTGNESVELSASELLSSLQNLAGWKNTPTLDFRSFGVAQAQIVSGIKDNAWTEYGVFWFRNTLVQLSWKDAVLRQEQETFDDILSTLKFK